MATLPTALADWGHLAYLVTNFPAFTADLTITVLQEDASPRPVLHATGTQCFSAIGYRPSVSPYPALPAGLTTVPLRLGDVTPTPAGFIVAGDLELCTCLTTYSTVNAADSSGAAYALRQLHALDGCCRSLARTIAPKSTFSPASIITARRALYATHNHMATAYPLLESDPTIGPLATELDAHAQQLLATAKRFLHTPALRARTLAKVGTYLVGKRNRTTFHFDETPTLVGLRDYAASTHHGLLDQLVVQFGTLHDTHVVLALPLYAAQWVTQQNSVSGLVPLAVLALTDTQSIIDVALFIWDPSARTAVSSLAGCLALARIV
jgi:hypothetical protein